MSLEDKRATAEILLFLECEIEAAGKIRLT